MTPAGHVRGSVVRSIVFAAVLGVVSALMPSALARTGPALSVPRAALVESLRCHGSLGAAGPRPVLLVPGTTLTPRVNFDWNYESAFSAAGRPWCAVTLPNHTMTDIQIAAEYVVHAIRAMRSRAGRAVSVVGFSQGGMVPRWALKWWPDTRSMVNDVIGLDPSNHGTLDAYAVCAVGGCAPAFWQQQTGSHLLAALNAGGETYAGISYSQIYTAPDEIVVPNFGPRASSLLHTGEGRIANVLVQSICPVHLSDHLSMGTVDPVGYALVDDALRHDGPARAARINRAVCLRATMPGVRLASAARNLLRVVAVAASQVLLARHVNREPALAPYARG